MSKKCKLLAFLIILGAVSGCSCGTMTLRSGPENDGDAASDVPVIDGRIDAGIPDYIPPGDGSWDPPIENMGDSGWRDSTAPWCPGIEGMILAYDVWSYFGGVYTIVANNINTGMTYEDVNHLYFNNGTGWALAYEAPASSEGMGLNSCYINITGIPDGPIFAWSGPSMSCNIATIESGSVQWGEFQVVDVFVVNEHLVYAISWMGDVKVIKYNGDTWSPVPAVVPYTVYHLWADEESVFAAGSGGTIVSLEGNQWIIHDPGTVGDFTSIWGFSGHDVWVGQSDGTLRHYDGESWTQVDWPNMSESGSRSILGMWGIDGTLFFHTEYQLTVWNGSGFTVLGYWENAGIFINAIWGNSPGEVFLAVSDPNHESSDCGPEYLLWWDGTNFHWF
jgi:hypothetical protein